MATQKNKKSCKVVNRSLAFVSAMVWTFGWMMPQVEATSTNAEQKEALKGRPFVSRVKQVTIFKDGTAHFLREGTVTQPGWYVTSPPPAAVLGSLWFLSNIPNQVDRVLTQRSQKQKKQPCRTMHETLAMNANRQVTLSLSDKTTLTGTLLASPSSPRPNAPPLPIEYFQIKTEQGVVSVPKEQIMRVAFSTPPQTHCTTYQPEARMFLRVRQATQPIRYSYIQKGLQWTPLYRLRLQNKRAEVLMQAVVSNAQESFHDAILRLVVGVPQLLNRDTFSPMTRASLLGRVVPPSPSPYAHRYRAPVAQSFQAQRFSNVYHRGLSSYSPQANQPADPAVIPEIHGQGANLGNLAIYQVGRVSLKKGARALVPVMRTTLPIRRFYLWQPSDAQHDLAPHHHAQQNVQQATRDRVWEYLELHNTTQLPLTTGPALLTENNEIQGQDMLRYTPPGGRVEIPITVAANVLSAQSHKEISRQHNARRIGYRSYTLATYEFRLTIVNFAFQKIDITVRKTINGHVISAADGKIIKKTSFDAVNPHNEVRYQTTLLPKQRWQATIRFERYL